MNWFRVSRGGVLEYCGRVTSEPFKQWVSTDEGRAAVARVATGLRFSLLGRKWAARRRIWRTLEDACRSTPASTAIAAEARRYMQVVARLAYSEALPRAQIALHRLVLVPRAMISGHARIALFKRLGDVPEFAALDDDVRVFLFDRLVLAMDAALQKASPSVRQPIQAHDEWACVGVSKELIWADPLWTGPDTSGHLFMYEFPRAGLSRRDRKTLEAAIASMSADVSSLTRLQRNAMVRAASAR